MSWLFSRALVEDSLLQKFSGGELSALLSWIPIAEAYLLGDKTNESLILSQYGMTCEPLTVNPGFHPLILSLEAFLAKHSATPRPAKIMPMIFGRKCSESWQMSLPHLSLPKTYLKAQSTNHAMTLKRWVTKPEQFPLARQTWVLTTFGKDIGYLHTPTTKANYCADSMQKWPSARNFKVVFGRPSPEIHEWLMGWPIGWSDLKPLETDRFQQWQQQHGGF